MNILVAVILEVFFTSAVIGVGYAFYKRSSITSKLSETPKTALAHLKCEVFPNEKAERAVYLAKVTGMILALKIETKVHFVSKKGHMQLLWKTLLYNLLLGWWSIKSFFMNGGVMGNNIASLFTYIELNNKKK